MIIIKKKKKKKKESANANSNQYCRQRIADSLTARKTNTPQGPMGVCFSVPFPISLRVGLPHMNWSDDS